MREPMPAPAAPVADPSPVYRPLSGLAAVGFGLAVLFFAGLSVAAIVALYKGDPLLLSIGWFVLPALATVLSALGWMQVTRSEGTRAGIKLARYGLWLAVLPALCYGGWRVGHELALRKQANDFTDAWFAQLRKSGNSDVDAYAAFWNALEPIYRDKRFDLNDPELQDKLRSNPKEFEPIQQAMKARHFWGDRGQKGNLPLFFDHDLVQLVRQAGEQAQIESQGVRRLDYHGGSAPGYLVEQSYRITTPEAVFDVAVPVRGVDSKEGKRRQWHIVMSEARVLDASPTPRGMLMAKLHLDSRRFAADWAKKLNQGQREEAYLETIPPNGRESVSKRYREHLLLPALAPTDGQPVSALANYAILADPELTRDLFLLGFREFASGALVRSQDLTADPKARDEIVKALRSRFRGVRSPMVNFHVMEESQHLARRWEINGDEVKFFQPFELTIGSKLRGEGYLVVASNQPLVTRAIAENDGNLALPPSGRSGRWRIAQVHLELAGVEVRTGPGQMPPPE
ncbi:MAG: hypothetical protein K2R98_22390 [Gemmataceae bacterium]|nr:hypothetical protein [Gemmataceae bacterium]